MDAMTVPLGGAWVGQAYTLPTVQRPLRLAEFDGLFTTALRSVERVDRHRIRLELAPNAAVAAVAGLAWWRLAQQRHTYGGCAGGGSCSCGEHGGDNLAADEPARGSSVRSLA